MADQKATAATGQTTAAASTAAPSTTRKMTKRTIIFRPPYTKKDGSTPNLASADILGCFGGVMLAVKDFAIKNANGHITVYMPSGMFQQSRVGPLGGELRSESDVVAEATTMSPEDGKAFIARERAKRLNVEILSDAIRDAWARCGGQLSVPVEIELPE